MRIYECKSVYVGICICIKQYLMLQNHAHLTFTKSKFNIQLLYFYLAHEKNDLIQIKIPHIYIALICKL